MKWKIKLKNDEGEVWFEWLEDEWVETKEEAIKFSLATIRRFNKNLPAGELPRYLVGISKKLEATPKPHVWEKTNLVTRLGKNGLSFDTYQCKLCRKTGKRFGLQEKIIPDNKSDGNCLELVVRF